MSALPELDVVRIRRFVGRRNELIPPSARAEVRIEVDVDDRSATILECRPPWRPGPDEEWARFPIARLRYTKSRREWALYWRDRNLKFHRYDGVAPSPTVESLLEEISRDPTNIFWG
jgi:hypothetical protein